MIILKMMLKDGGYSRVPVYGLGNSLVNYLIASKKFEDENLDIDITPEECICVLEDNKRINEYDTRHIQGVYSLHIKYKNTRHDKIGKIDQIISFLSNLNVLFNDEKVKSIRIQKENNCEIL